MTPCNKKDSQSHSTGYRNGCRCADCCDATAQYGLKYQRDNKSAIAAQKVEYGKTPARMASRRQVTSSRRSKMKGKPEHLSLLTAIYALCPAGWHVDHIVPLTKGGLHDPANLQYLTACDNQAKGAKTDYIPVTPAQRWQDWACTLI